MVIVVRILTRFLIRLWFERTPPYNGCLNLWKSNGISTISRIQLSWGFIGSHLTKQKILISVRGLTGTTPFEWGFIGTAPLGITFILVVIWYKPRFNQTKAFTAISASLIWWIVWMKLVARSSEDQTEDADESIKEQRKCITAIKTNFIFDSFVAYFHVTMWQCDTSHRSPIIENRNEPSLFYTSHITSLFLN